MQSASTDSVQPFYWDRFRDTSMGRYLFQCEYAFVRRSLCSVEHPRNVLDVCCGSGRMTLPLLHAGLNVVGLDIDPAALTAFRRRSEKAPLVSGTALNLPFPEDSFDCVIAIQCFEYFDHY